MNEILFPGSGLRLNKDGEESRRGVKQMVMMYIL